MSGAAAHDRVLAAERIHENVPEVGQGRKKEAWIGATRLVDRLRGETQRVPFRLEQPDGMGVSCRQFRVSESSRDPTPRP